MWQQILSQKAYFAVWPQRKHEFGINFLIYPVEKIKQSLGE